MAKVKRKRIDNADERQILTGMIVSGRVCREIEPIYKPEFLQIPFGPQVAQWCLDYYRRYKKPPRLHIQDIYNSWTRKHPDNANVELIGDFLEGLSGEYERAKKFNASLILDKAEETFKSTSLKHLSEDIEAALTKGDAKRAEQALVNYKRVERPTTDGFNPYTDVARIRHAFEQNEEPLFSLPGAAGQLMNEFFVREGLVGFMGKEKIGKTWMIHELGHRAMPSECNVAEFQVGDMSGPQMTVRTHIRLAGRSNRLRYCGEILVPVLDCERNQQGSCSRSARKCTRDLQGVERFEDAPRGYRPCTVCHESNKARLRYKFRGAVWYKIRKPVEPLPWREGYKKGRRFMRNVAGDFRLSVHPNGSVNVQDITAILDRWEIYEGFVPDVITVDYADILAPEPGDERKDIRDQQNNTWKALRRLSQERHCLVISATQTDAASYEATLMQRKHFSEDKRKYGHVTVMFGLNQTDEEKAAGLFRVNAVLAREEEFDPRRTVKILQCLQVGRPLIASYW